MNAPLCSPFVPHKICHSRAGSHRQAGLKSVCINYGTTVLVPVCQIWFCNLNWKMSQWCRSSKFLLGPASWEAYYKQADNTGWASSSACHNATLSPLWYDSTMSVYSVFPLALWIPRESLQLQLPLYCCTFSAAPIPSLQCGQRPKTHNLPQAKAGTVDWTGLGCNNSLGHKY